MAHDQTCTHEHQREMFAAEQDAADAWAEKYTKEPWALSLAPPRDLPAGLPAINTRLTCAGAIIATFEVGFYSPGDRTESAANARRAAVCVNKLHGISTRELEKLPDGLLAQLLAEHRRSGASSRRSP